MELTDHTAATTKQFAARLDRFDRGVPNPPEVQRERLIEALYESTSCAHLVFDGEAWCDEHDGEWPCRAGRAADAALAVIGDQQDTAVQRVLALDERAEERVRSSTPTVTAERLIAEGAAPTVSTGALRAAVAGSDA